jgi:hypothetical protein
MERKYWAALGDKIIGPFATQGIAIVKGRAEFAKALKRNPTKRITIGYGSTGPWFDIRWYRLDD